jgi:tRNA G10  N-methylase Trm11
MADAHPLPYFFRIAAPTGHEELAALELRAFAGEVRPDDETLTGDAARIFWGRAGVDVGRSAYVAECCHGLASAADFGGLLRAMAKLSLRRERFRIVLRRLGTRAVTDSQEVIVAVANAIEGRPDLERPVCEMVVVAREGRWLLGELVSRSAATWRGHEHRPHQYSSALPPRFARALVNLVAVPGDSLVDPCCGVGTVLIEASEAGVAAYGWESNPPVVEHARANVCHWGVDAPIVEGDGRAFTGAYDGAVLDLPYGHSSVRIEAICRGLVARAAERCRFLAVVSGGDMTGFLGELGLTVLGMARVRKGGLVRHVHWVTAANGG